MLNFENHQDNKICVVGVGDTGCKIIEKIKTQNINFVDFISINNHKNNLTNIDENFILLSNNDTTLAKNNNFNEFFFDDSLEKLKNKISKYNLLILTGGFGGNLGTTLIPVISEISKKLGILTLCVISSPFSYEGKEKEEKSNIGLTKLKKNADSFAIISSNKIINNYPDILKLDAFILINNLLKNCVVTFINFFSNEDNKKTNWFDLKSFLKNKGELYIGFGNWIGKNKIFKSVNQALNSKIIDKSLKSISNVILNIKTDPLFLESEIEEIISIIKNKINNKNLNIIFKHEINQNLRNEIQLAIIASSEDNQQNKIVEIFDLEDKKLQDTQELLVKIGSTLENELNNFSTNEHELENFDFNHNTNEKNENKFVIDAKNNDDDDDIPFFLK